MTTFNGLDCPYCNAFNARPGRCIRCFEELPEYLPVIDREEDTDFNDALDAGDFDDIL